METTTCDPEQPTFISQEKILKSLKKIEDKLLKLCKEDEALVEIVPVLEACKNDLKYNNLIKEHLNARSDYHSGRAFKLSMELFDKQTCFIFVKSNSNIQDLRRAIERDLSIRVQIQSKQEQRFCKKLFKKLNWKRLWKTYDILIDETCRVSYYQKEPLSEIDLKLSDKSALKFVLKRQ